jgi:hypothetical protein
MRKIYCIVICLSLFACERVRISERSISLQEGEQKEIAVEGKLQDRQFEWRSNNPQVAEVSDEGVVKALSGGQTYVKLVITANQQVVDSVRIEVLSP